VTLNNNNSDFITITGTYSKSLKEKDNLYLFGYVDGKIKKISKVNMMEDNTWRVDFTPEDKKNFDNKYRNMVVYFADDVTAGTQIIGYGGGSGEVDLEHSVNGNTFEKKILTSLQLNVIYSDFDWKLLSKIKLTIKNIKSGDKLKSKNSPIIINGTYSSPSHFPLHDIYLVENIYIPKSGGSHFIRKTGLVFMNDSTWTVKYVPTRINNKYNKYGINFMIIDNTSSKDDTPKCGSANSNGDDSIQIGLDLLAYLDATEITSWITTLANINVEIKATK